VSACPQMDAVPPLPWPRSVADALAYRDGPNTAERSDAPAVAQRAQLIERDADPLFFPPDNVAGNEPSVRWQD
jgi:hypothetical protein